MSYNISTLSYRRNSTALQTVTKRSKSIITIINGRNVMIDNTGILWDQPATCSKQWPSIKRSKYAGHWNYSRTLQQDLITLLISPHQLYKECPGKNNHYWKPILNFNKYPRYFRQWLSLCMLQQLSVLLLRMKNPVWLWVFPPMHSVPHVTVCSNIFASVLSQADCIVQAAHIPFQSNI